jgi:hypothetical protein
MYMGCSSQRTPPPSLNLIYYAFKATGIWLMDRLVVTRKFDYTTPLLQTNNMG